MKRFLVMMLLLVGPVALFASPPLDDHGPMFVAKAPIGTALGTATEAVDGTVELAGVTVPAGSMLIVCYGEINEPVEIPASATFDGNAMNLVNFVGDGDENALGEALYYYYSATTTTGTISITATGGSFGGSALTARSWTRIQDTTPDGNDVQDGPDNPMEFGFIGTATDMITCGVAYRAAKTGTWGAPMVAGQTAAVGDLKLTEAYLSPAGASVLTATINFTGGAGEPAGGVLAGFFRQ